MCPVRSRYRVSGQGIPRHIAAGPRRTKTSGSAKNPANFACQAPNPPNSMIRNRIQVAEELWSILYNRGSRETEEALATRRGLLLAPHPAQLSHYKSYIYPQPSCFPKVTSDFR